MNTIVRLFVLALTVSGTAAFTTIHNASDVQISSSKANSMPAPFCDPNGPSTCGYGK